MSLAKITTQGLKIRAILAKSGSWMTRAQLAHAMGKKRLNPHDLELINRMIVSNEIDVRVVESNTPVGVANEYRVKEVVYG